MSMRPNNFEDLGWRACNLLHILIASRKKEKRKLFATRTTRILCNTLGSAFAFSTLLSVKIAQTNKS